GTPHRGRLQPPPHREAQRCTDLTAQPLPTWRAARSGPTITPAEHFLNTLLGETLYLPGNGFPRCAGSTGVELYRELRAASRNGMCFAPLTAMLALLFWVAVLAVLHTYFFYPLLL